MSATQIQRTEGFNEAGNEIVQSTPRRTNLGDMLMAKKSSLAAVATRQLPPEKLIKVILVAGSRNPVLFECTQESILQCAMTLSELGLVPGPLGEAYLIPYYNSKIRAQECQVIIGYKGLMTLARRSGFITSIQSEVVREGDEFRYEFGIDTVFRHAPKGDESKAITHAWALFKFKDGGHHLTVMTKAQIDGVRNKSKAGKFGPWVDHYEEMAKKTAIRRGCKMVPLSIEEKEQIEKADRTEFNFDEDAIRAAASSAPALTEGTDKAETLADKLSAPKTETKTDEPPQTSPEDAAKFQADLAAAQPAQPTLIPDEPKAGRKK